MIHSFLLIGQSNMAGRGFANEVEGIPNNRIKVLRNGRWWPMFRPVNPDRVTAGVCLAESFAYEYSKAHNVDVGLIPCADGGSCIDQWATGGLLYDNAVAQAKLASRTSTIAGILWHQGESDCPEGRHVVYKEKFVKIINNLRRDLNLYDVPFIVGGLGDYLNENNNPVMSYVKNYAIINCILRDIVKENPMMGFADATGLGANDDLLHFNAKSLLEFGVRYYKEFEKIEDKNKVFEEKANQDDAFRSEMEKW